MTHVYLTYDFDAVAVWLHDPDLEATPTNRSRGRFGAEVGAPRLLDLHEDLGVPATWFVPGHTIESYPAMCERIVQAGHEVAHHGWSHRPPTAYESAAAERTDLERGIEAIESLTGRRPAGYRSPAWEFSDWTIDLLLELGFEWDSSGMARDFELYSHTVGEHVPANGPYDPGEPTDLVCVPVSWRRDDSPRLAVDPGAGAADESAVFRTWRDGFDWAHANVSNGVFVLTLHPQIIGRGHRIERLGELVDYMASRRGVEFATVSAVVDMFRRDELDTRPPE